MKRIMYIIGCLIIAVTSCNTDDVEPVETQAPLLTKISRNGITQLELFYDIGKRLYRLNYYSASGTFINYNLYEYSDAGIKELRRHNAGDHALDYQTVFTLDNFGRIIKGENYSAPDFDKINSVNQFHYNTSGRLIRKDFSIPGNPIYSREEYTYDDQNNLIIVQNTVYPTQPGKYMSYQVDYTPGDKSIPVAWENYIFILKLSAVDDGIRYMFNDNTHAEYWDSEQETFGESSTEPSGRMFNDDGNLTRQVLTHKNILKPQNADVVSEMTYEYVQ